MTIEQMIKRALRTGQAVSAKPPIRFPEDPGQLDRKGCQIEYDEETSTVTVTPPPAGDGPLPPDS